PEPQPPSRPPPERDWRRANALRHGRGLLEHKEVVRSGDLKTHDTPSDRPALDADRPVWNQGCEYHLGQRFCATALQGRTYDRNRLDLTASNVLAIQGPSTYAVRQDAQVADALSAPLSAEATERERGHRQAGRAAGQHLDRQAREHRRQGVAV